MLDLRGTEISALHSGDALKALDTDGITLFSGGEGGVVRVWDITSGTEKNELEGDTTEALSCIFLVRRVGICVCGVVR